MGNDSISKTFGVALALCVVCAVVVSSAAVILRPTQEVNKLLDLKANILASAGLLQEGVSIETQFEQISTRVVDLQTGEFTDAVDAATYDQRKASKDPALSMALDPKQDPAKIKRRANYATVYMVEGEQGIEKIILPIKGYGLWSTLYGFLALEADFETVAGIGFYEHTETPGLGGEVDNPRWKASWVGKQAYNQGELAITVLKGKADMSRAGSESQIDGLAGATLTTRGVDNLVRYWLGDEGFRPLINSLKSGEA
ncbi:Na(+)-translocating NADH-quinone reductase subunit C [Porticoccaceae bacterium]|nr:Na(+)-translocating NADH-quinone reductase subunit C [Porticoccaceae bacterium]MCT2533702.1 Na(+)-translocating NADH-quinone reductase subunit C [SAR92 clade bacterium H231]MBT6318703.1 Na(+)-translocating NADH-quinone reductase subunit C [Porticoccaceae bacterium]MBT7258923.1 Na(+)-translocating NADH-quinone reductase subunit C [Porticoccaceae bacterium]MBT7903865.1 Na(+)-translocating NADH-quinone reductase subunit C [Porticoccaceae bacterium]